MTAPEDRDSPREERLRDLVTRQFAAFRSPKFDPMPGMLEEELLAIARAHEAAVRAEAMESVTACRCFRHALVPPIVKAPEAQECGVCIREENRQKVAALFMGSGDFLGTFEGAIGLAADRLDFLLKRAEAAEAGKLEADEQTLRWQCEVRDCEKAVAESARARIEAEKKLKEALKLLGREIQDVSDERDKAETGKREAEERLEKSIAKCEQANNHGYVVKLEAEVAQLKAEAERIRAALRPQEEKP